MKEDLIHVILNGFGEAIHRDTTIAQLVERREEYDVGLIVELNNKFIFPQDYGKTVVKEGDKLEFINPDFGG
ncbi:MAG: thiamine biosynthesis protein ThiS [Syntrophus sp. (in: bacteria)]|nr:thiamine biosynthesis protein ThiS [Syntrophus sp. (in: bacteria)]